MMVVHRECDGSVAGVRRGGGRRRYVRLVADCLSFLLLLVLCWWWLSVIVEAQSKSVRYSSRGVLNRFNIIR